MILFLDTNVIIYALEAHTTWGLPAQTRIAAAQAAGDTFMISDLVRMECLVLPIRQGHAALEGQYHTFFARSDIRVMAITAAVCDRAAHIRASYNFKPMDALQLAAAVEHGANIFLTADARLSSFPGLTVEILS
jgi:predicted nucleic acid-binding protein